MERTILARAAGSRCATAVRSAIWAWTKSAYTVRDERLGLGALDGVTKIRRWDGGIETVCIPIAWERRYGGLGQDWQARSPGNGCVPIIQNTIDL